MAISQDYTNRLIDLCVLNTSSNAGLERVQVGLLDSGSVISGSYKVVQKFVKFLLTEIGSVAAEPDYGTDFVRRLFNGSIQTSSELNLRFYQEAITVKNYVQQSNNSSSPDENLISVSLDSFNVTSGDTATMTIRFIFENRETILAPVQISTV
jgi:hypothetical protein